jgi:uncharacterized protein YkwD
MPLRTAPIRATLACVAALGLALASTGAPASPAGAAPGDGFSAHLVRLVNDYRQGQGLPPLAPAQDLILLADEHSRSMAAQRRLSHEGFSSRFERAASAVCVENVAWNHPTAETVVDGWRRSPSHHVNLLDPQVQRVGVARSLRFVTFFACR